MLPLDIPFFCFFNDFLNGFFDDCFLRDIDGHWHWLWHWCMSNNLWWWWVHMYDLIVVHRCHTLTSRIIHLLGKYSRHWISRPVLGPGLVLVGPVSGFGGMFHSTINIRIALHNLLWRICWYSVIIIILRIANFTMLMPLRLNYIFHIYPRECESKCY